MRGRREMNWREAVSFEWPGLSKGCRAEGDDDLTIIC